MQSAELQPFTLNIELATSLPPSRQAALITSSSITYIYCLSLVYDDTIYMSILVPYSYIPNTAQ